MLMLKIYIQAMVSSEKILEIPIKSKSQFTYNFKYISLSKELTIEVKPVTPKTKCDLVPKLNVSALNQNAHNNSTIDHIMNTILLILFRSKLKLKHKASSQCVTFSNRIMFLSYNKCIH